MRQVLAHPSQLGALIKATRKQAGLSQQELARRVGVSQSRMSHMELNPGSISLEQLLAIFGALRLEVMIGFKPYLAQTGPEQPYQTRSSSGAARPDPGEPEW